MITLLKHCDRVKIACLAQLVNVIAPIMTSDTAAWRQTIYYPFKYTSNYGRGTVLQTITEVETYDIAESEHVPYLDSIVVWNEEKDELVIFAVNKNLEEDITLTCPLEQFSDFHPVEHVVLTHDDLKAVNTEEDQDNVAPVTVDDINITDGSVTVTCPKKSWNMVRLER